MEKETEPEDRICPSQSNVKALAPPALDVTSEVAKSGGCQQRLVRSLDFRNYTLASDDIKGAKSLTMTMNPGAIKTFLELAEDDLRSVIEGALGQVTVHLVIYDDKNPDRAYLNKSHSERDYSQTT